MIEIYEKTGELPTALKNRPGLPEGWDVPLKVFENVSGSRQSKFSGVGEIPYSEFFLYATSIGYRGADLNDLWEEVHLIDMIYVNQLTKMQKSNKEPQKPTK